MSQLFEKTIENVYTSLLKKPFNIIELMVENRGQGDLI